MGWFLGIDYWQFQRSALVGYVSSLTQPNFELQGKGRLASSGIGEVFATNLFGHYVLTHEVTGPLEQGKSS
jgi:hypothetical protein